MRINWFLIMIGWLYFGAGITSLLRQKPLWGVQLLFYAVTTFIMAALEAKS